ncbi:MAG: hypothetical protein JWR15_3732, partial [Prosthecobacter sp.]|nr:hypothetical protein [Prosthecobacter sp.]
VDGSVASPNVYVNAGGTLGGNGVLTGAVFNSGTVSPGHSPGTLTLGSYTQSSTGSLVIEVASSTVFDQLVVTQGARLNGTLRVIRLNNYQPTKGTYITFLTAGDGVSGTFRKVKNDFIQPGSLVRLDVKYNPNDVGLVASQNSFTSALAIVTDAGRPAYSLFKGITSNQIATARALDRALFDPRQKGIITCLDNLKFDRIPHQLDLIAPEELTSIYTLSFAQMETQFLSIEQRMADIRNTRDGQSAPDQPDSPPNGKSTPPEVVMKPDDRFGNFITATGNFTSQNGTANAGGYDLKTGGALIGFDCRVTDSFSLGLAIGFDRTQSDLAEGGRLDVDGGRAALYAQYYHDHGFFAQTILGGGYNSYDTGRTALQGRAGGSTNGGELDAAVNFGCDMELKSGLHITPLASLLYTLAGIDGYTEHGSMLPLRIQGQSQDALRSRLGLQASYEFKTPSALIVPSLSAQWQHAFTGTELDFDSRFANGAGATYSVLGPDTGRDSALLTAAVNILWGRYALYLAYQADVGRDNYESQSLLLGLRYSW